MYITKQNPDYLKDNLGDWLDWIKLEYTPPDYKTEQKFRYHFKPNPAVKLPNHAHWIKCPKCMESLVKQVDALGFVEKKMFMHFIIIS